MKYAKILMVFVLASFIGVSSIAQDCSAFATAPVDLTKSFDPVDGIQDRVQVKWFKASPEVRYSDADAAMCDIKFWAKRTLDPCTGLPVGPAIVNPDTIVIQDAKKTYGDGSPREIFKWPVKFKADGANNNKRADANTRYEWQVRCECGHDGNGPESPWSDVKIFNTPNFDATTGIYTAPPTVIYLPDTVSGPAIVQDECLPPPVGYVAACDQACAQQVIDADPFCLENTWDSLCQDAYLACTGGGSGIYLPDVVASGPALVDPDCIPAGYSLAADQVCAQQVIDADPFCVENSFDQICQDAYDLCANGGPTCDDGIQNGDETGVDCGGPDCPACPGPCDGLPYTIFLPDTVAGPAVLVCSGDPAPAGYVPAANQGCAQAVIDADPFCLENSWDTVCQGAYDECTGDACGGVYTIYLPDAIGGGPAVTSCGLVPAGYSAAGDQACAQQTIDNDSFCIDTQWDGICQDDYDLCVGAFANTTTNENKSLTHIQVGLYPNPNDGTGINLQFSETSELPYTLQVTDMTGRVIHSEQLNVNKNLVFAIDFSNKTLSNGVYMMNLIQGDVQNNFRFVVK